MTLWLVPADAAGLARHGRLRRPRAARQRVRARSTADGVRVPATRMLGDDGAGLDIALAVVLPWFLVCSAAFSVGTDGGGHRRDHRGTSPATRSSTSTRRSRSSRHRASTSRGCSIDDRQRTGVRRRHARRARTGAATTRCCACSRSRRRPAKRRSTVTDLAMKVCGGAAFRKEVGIERRFRDARAGARHGADHRRAARLHRPRGVRPASRCSGTCDGRRTRSLMGAVAYDPKVVTIWDGFRRWFADARLRTSTTSCTPTTSARSRTWSRAHRRGVELAAGLGAAACGWPAPRASRSQALAMRDTDSRPHVGRSSSRADSRDRRRSSDLRGRRWSRSARSTRRRPR